MVLTLAQPKIAEFCAFPSVLKSLQGSFSFIQPDEPDPPVGNTILRIGSENNACRRTRRAYLADT